MLRVDDVMQFHPTTCRPYDTLDQAVQVQDILVSSAMSEDVRTCAPTDSLRDVEKTMMASRVHRLPVVDERGRVVGIISLSDIIREAARERKLKRFRDVTDSELCEVLSAFCGPLFAERVRS